jgi:hypothetical protein
MQEIVQKLRDEHRVLFDKLGGLEAAIFKFNQDPDFNQAHLSLLEDQKYYMGCYAEILRIRISLLEEKK